VEDDKALIISKDITHVNMPYNKELEDCFWETCTLREWLNNDFLGTFSQSEQSRIILSNIIREHSHWYETKDDYFIQDRIFLLSISEVIQYFGDGNKISDFKNYLNTVGYIANEYSKERISHYQGVRTDWWLRSPGKDKIYNGGMLQYTSALIVLSTGIINYSGNACNYYGGVRPALWLKF
jgi:hypothetical protein